MLGLPEGNHLQSGMILLILGRSFVSGSFFLYWITRGYSHSSWWNSIESPWEFRQKIHLNPHGISIKSQWNFDRKSRENPEKIPETPTSFIIFPWQLPFSKAWRATMKSQVRWPTSDSVAKRTRRGTARHCSYHGSTMSSIVTSMSLCLYLDISRSRSIKFIYVHVCVLICVYIYINIYKYTIVILQYLRGCNFIEHIPVFVS